MQLLLSISIGFGLLVLGWKDVIPLDVVFFLLLIAVVVLAISIDKQADHDESSLKVARETPPNGIVISKKLIDEMTEMARENLPDEVGGLLIGKRTGSVVEIVAVENEEMQERMLDGVIYVGEWCSHSVGSSSPTCIDIAAMVDVANSQECSVAYPILATVGFYGGVSWSFVSVSKSGAVKVLVQGLSDKSREEG